MNAMKSNRSIRIATIGAAAAVLLAGTTLSAAAIPSVAQAHADHAVGKRPKPSLSPSMLSPSPSKASPSASASSMTGYITLRATPTTVKAGKPVTLTGRIKGLPIGTKLTLQEKIKGRWVSLPATTTVNRGSSFKLITKLRGKGKQSVRVKNVKTVSPPVIVTVG